MTLTLSRVMKKRTFAIGVVIIAILVSSACVVAIPVPGLAPATAPVIIEPTWSQEAAAPTLTLVFTETLAPTLTASFTPTFFPTITPFPTATLTPSITPSLIPVEIATLGGEMPQGTLTQIALTPLSSGDPIGAEFSCIVTAKRVADSTVFTPKYQFTAWWDIKNVGRKKWDSDVVTAYLIEGVRMASDRYASLPSEPKPGESVRLRIEMVTPAQEGTYLTTWGLLNARTNRHFCFFTLKIIVKK